MVGLVRLADHAARAVKKRVREAFARRPKDLGGSAAPLVRRFLERTETDFFGTQGRILEALEGDMTPEPALRDWHAVVARAASGVFDEAVQPAEVSATYVERAARAWNHLRRDLYGRAAWECLGLTPPLKPVPTKNGASA